MKTVRDDNIAKIEDLAHTHVDDCYQCGKCTAGCPMGDVMDVPPHQLIRLVQMGRTEKAASSESVWQCVSCLTCSTRCPKEVDIAGVLDALRQVSLEDNVDSKAQQRTVVFQQAFLDNIRRNGRLAEFELVGMYKTAAFLKDLNIPLLMADSLLAPKMIARHKLHFLPKRVKDRGVVKRIFERCEQSK